MGNFFVVIGWLFLKSSDFIGSPFYVEREGYGGALRCEGEGGSCFSPRNDLG